MLLLSISNEERLSALICQLCFRGFLRRLLRECLHEAHNTATSVGTQWWFSSTLLISQKKLNSFGV